MGAVRDLEGRPRGLGRDRARLYRRRDRREALRRVRSKLADCVAPALLVAQGIGRFGNWWNQELFGGPTDLPWGLKIDPENRPIDHVDQETFHPTFLYEALWCFAAAGVLLLIERRFKGAFGRAGSSRSTS